LCCWLKVRVVLLVDLVPNLLAVQRIAFFRENVHILYMTEMAQNSRFLLLMLSPGYPEKCKVTGCNLHFLRIAPYGKKSTLWD
jgi:hypothetical protein